MEEHQVTIGNETLVLPSPFFVIATQNPLEHEGTYPLPEAELDRFFMKIIISYPAPEDEKMIFSQRNNTESSSSHPENIKPKELIEIQEYIRQNIRVDEKILDYISSILEVTRGRHTSIKSSEDSKNSDARMMNLHPLLSYGASTRAGLALIDGARVVALLEDRDYVTPDDIKYIAHEVL